MNEPTWFQRVNDALKRRYGIQGDGPVTTFASDAFPTINVDDDHLSAELHYLAQSRLAMAGKGLGALALNYGQIVLENPTSSGVIAVVERIGCYVSGGVPEVRFAGAIASVITYDGSDQGPRDTRLFSAVGSYVTNTCRVGTLQSAAALSGIRFYNFPQRPDFEIPVGTIVLRPGSQLLVGSSDVNTTCYASFVWRERAVNSWELSG